jgi:hypothetical protein
VPITRHRAPYTAATPAIFRAYFRDPVSVFFAFGFPLLILIPVGLIHRGQTVTGGLAYIDYTACGVAGTAFATAALFSGAYAVLRLGHGDDKSGAVRRPRRVLLPAPCAHYTVAIVVALIQAVIFTASAEIPRWAYTSRRPGL